VASSPALCTSYKLAFCLVGTFRWRLPAVCWQAGFPRRRRYLCFGVLLHFFIATSVAAIYYGASRTLRFLIEHPLVCGLFYGMAVESVLILIVFTALRSPRPARTPSRICF
jgi:hypothetical protein